MKIVIAIDSLKGSLSSIEAGRAAEAGIRKAFSGTGFQPEIVVKPLADGGEGTTESLITGLGGEKREVSVKGPLGKPVGAVWGLLPDKKTAVMEMASAAGITLISENERDPHRATTFGVGEMIADAIKAGCRDFIIGIGGSATTEGGIGMLEALGFEFFDADGNKLPPVFDSLNKIAAIDASKRLPALDDCSFRIACDVTNPLCGEKGAIAVYGRQKGVKNHEILSMDAIMKHYAEAAEAFSGRHVKMYPGAGAAGGLGFAFLNFFPQAALEGGVSLILQATGLEGEIKTADLVITGEGFLDRQTLNGKAPIGVANLAKRYGKPVIAFAGGLSDDVSLCHEQGIDACFPIVRGVTSLADAMESSRAEANMTAAANEVFRALLTAKGVFHS